MDQLCQAVFKLLSTVRTSLTDTGIYVVNYWLSYWLDLCSHCSDSEIIIFIIIKIIDY